jgi:hypothetical protein
MKQIRGIAALEYATKNGLEFLVDEAALRDAESRIQAKPVTLLDIDSLLQTELGESYDPTKVIEGSRSFDFLLQRYGDEWIYMPLEGNHPDEEESAVLRLYRQRLSSDSPSSGGDVVDLATENPPTLSDTGFPPDADVDLLFHAAKRLVSKGLLRSVSHAASLSDDIEPNYGNTYFFVPSDVEISLLGVLCEECHAQRDPSRLDLHTECANRLRNALARGA